MVQKPPPKLLLNQIRCFADADIAFLYFSEKLFHLLLTQY